MSVCWWHVGMLHVGCKFSGNVTLRGNFRKFSLIIDITDRLGTTVNLNKNMHEYT